MQQQTTKNGMMQEDLKSKIAEILKMPPDRLSDESVLTDLVNDSFMLVDLVIEMQDELGILIMQEELRQVRTVGDLVKLCAAKLN